MFNKNWWENWLKKFDNLIKIVENWWKLMKIYEKVNGKMDGKIDEKWIKKMDENWWKNGWKNEW